MQELSTPPAEQSAPTGGSTRRDLVRIALRDLVALATECTATEAQIEQRYKTTVEEAEKVFQRAGRELDHKYQDTKESITRKAQERLAQVDQQFEVQRKKLQVSEKAARQKIDNEHAAVERQVKQQFEQAAWLAESVLEATQIQVAVEMKQAREYVAGQLAALDDVERAAGELLVKYRQTPPQEPAPAEPPPAPGEAPKETPASEGAAREGEAPTQPHGEGEAAAQHTAGEGTGGTVATPPAEPPKPAQAVLVAERQNAEQELAHLGKLQIPRMFIGARPHILIILLLILGGAAGQLAVSRTLNAAMVPHWRPIVYGLGGAGVFSAALAILLWIMGKAHVRRTWIPLQNALAAARAAADRQLKETAEAAKKHLADAVARRDADVQAAKDKCTPILTKATKARDASLAAAAAEVAAQLPKLQGQAQRMRDHARQWETKNQDDLRRRYEAEQKAIGGRHDSALQQSQGEYQQARTKLERRLNEGLKTAGAPIAAGDGSPASHAEDWSGPQWNDWLPPKTFPLDVRFGELTVDLKKFAAATPQGAPLKLTLPPAFSVPSTLAFPRQASLLIHADQGGRGEGMRILQMLMARLLTSLPAGRVRFTIIDPVGLGQNFAGFMHLADHDDALVGGRIWTEGEHIEQRLCDLTEHMETVIQKYLRNEFETIDDYNAQAGELAEPYRFLVIADFPVGFSDESTRRLSSVASSGARCGVYTLVLRDTRQMPPSGTVLEELEANSVTLVQEGDKFVWKDDVFRQFPLTMDGPPAEDFLTRILDIVGKYAKEAKRVEVPFDTIAPKPAQFWTGSAAEEVEVPIGRMGATRLQALRLGRGVAQHTLIAGKTGSGKSTLLHAIVTNLAMWYPPDEVEFYLVDFKKGVEFKTYATNILPHARAIAVESDREFGLSVLQRLDGELARRGGLYRKAGVQDLAAYRQIPGAKIMPRTLLIIDEFQEFFSEDDKLAQDAGLLLDRLVRQGRAFGIHVLLGSQTIGGTSGLARSTIGQMAVRVALQCSEADSQLILGDNNSAARLLSRPGEAIYNDAGGLVESNSPFQVAWLPDERRDQYLAQVRALWAQRKVNVEPAIVFEGNAPADISKNEQLAKLIAAPGRLSATAPSVTWLGEPVAIKEPTSVTFRRQSGANVLIVGQQEEAAMAIMAASMVSLGAQHAPGSAIFYILDGSPADSPLSRVFAAVKPAIPHEVKLVEFRAVPEAIAEIAKEMAERQSPEQTGHPKSIYVLIYGLQRYRVLRKQEESFGFSSGDEEKGPPTDKQFADLLKEGPGLGIHTIVWADTPISVDRTLDRNSMREFDNRILFQMSAADSSNLIDSPMANKLGFHRALAYSEEQGVMEKFRPYALPDRAWLAQVQESLCRASAAPA